MIAHGENSQGLSVMPPQKKRNTANRTGRSTELELMRFFGRTTNHHVSRAVGESHTKLDLSARGGCLDDAN